MNTWYDYRSVWSAHRWVLAYAIIVVSVLIVSIIATFVGATFALLFIPALAGVYVHHLIVQKRLDQR
ncbi:MAG: hypothetical protein ACRDVG_07895 [Jatrophihabitantaceae bacterium]